MGLAYIISVIGRFLSITIFTGVLIMALVIKVQFWYNFYMNSARMSPQELQEIAVCMKGKRNGFLQLMARFSPVFIHMLAFFAVCDRRFPDDLFDSTWCRRSCYISMGSKILRTFTCLILLVTYRLFTLTCPWKRLGVMALMLVCSFNFVVVWETFNTCFFMYYKRQEEIMMQEFSE